MEEWIIAVIAIGSLAVSFIIAGGGIMWRQGRSEGKLCSEIKTLSEAFHTYAEKNDRVIITCTQAIGQNAEDISYLKGWKNGAEEEKDRK